MNMNTMLILPVLLATVLMLPNACVIGMISQNATLRGKPKNVFVCGLAGSNLLVIATAIIRLVGSEMLDIYIHARFTLCNMLISLNFLCRVVYMCNVLLANLELFLSIAKPFWHHVHLKDNPGFVLRLMLKCWGIALILFTTAIIGTHMLFDKMDIGSSKDAMNVVTQFQDVDAWNASNIIDTEENAMAYPVMEEMVDNNLNTTETPIFPFNNLFTEESYSENDSTYPSASAIHQTLTPDNLINASVSTPPYRSITPEEHYSVDACALDHWFDLRLVAFHFIAIDTTASLVQGSVIMFIIYQAFKSKTNHLGASDQNEKKKVFNKVKAASVFMVIWMTYILTSLPMLLPPIFQNSNDMENSFRFLWDILTLSRFVKLTLCDPILFILQCHDLTSMISRCCHRI